MIFFFRISKNTMLNKVSDLFFNPDYIDVSVLFYLLQTYHTVGKSVVGWGVP